MEDERVEHSDEEFSDADDDELYEKIIDVMLKLPWMWDTRRADYRSRTKKSNGWASAAAALGETVDFVKRKWKTMKNRYNKIKKKLVKPTGSAGPTPHPNWSCYERMKMFDCNSTDQLSGKDNFGDANSKVGEISNEEMEEMEEHNSLSSPRNSSEQVLNATPQNNNEDEDGDRAKLADPLSAARSPTMTKTSGQPPAATAHRKRCSAKRKVEDPAPSPIRDVGNALSTLAALQVQKAARPTTVVDEFSAFGECVAMKLRALPSYAADRAQIDILQVISYAKECRSYAVAEVRDPVRDDVDYLGNIGAE